MADDRRQLLKRNMAHALDMAERCEFLARQHRRQGLEELARHGERHRDEYLDRAVHLEKRLAELDAEPPSNE